MKSIRYLLTYFSNIISFIVETALNQEGLKYLGEYLNSSVGHTQTDPNALGESDLWVLNGNIENLSRLVAAQNFAPVMWKESPVTTEFNGGVCQTSWNFMMITVALC